MITFVQNKLDQEALRAMKIHRLYLIYMRLFERSDFNGNRIAVIHVNIYHRESSRLVAQGDRICFTGQDS